MELPNDIKAALDKKVFVHLATINPDGSPQVSVVWADRDGDKVLISTATGRIKPRNIEHDSRVAMSFTPPDQPYQNIMLQGTVTKAETDGNWLIDRLANKYLGHDTYQYHRAGEQRVNYEIEIDKVAFWGARVLDDQDSDDS